MQKQKQFKWRRPFGDDRSGYGRLRRTGRDLRRFDESRGTADYVNVNGKAVAVESLERAERYPGRQDQTAHYKIRIGQRFHRVGYTGVVWRATMIYRDAQGHEHATLKDEAGRLDAKTLSASVLLDSAQYRVI